MSDHSLFDAAEVSICMRHRTANNPWSKIECKCSRRGGTQLAYGQPGCSESCVPQGRRDSKHPSAEITFKILSTDQQQRQPRLLFYCEHIAASRNSHTEKLFCGATLQLLSVLSCSLWQEQQKSAVHSSYTPSRCQKNSAAAAAFLVGSATTIFNLPPQFSRQPTAISREEGLQRDGA